MPAALAYNEPKKFRWKKVGAVAGVILLLLVSSLAIASVNKLRIFSRLYQGEFISQTGWTEQTPSFGGYILESEPATATPFTPQQPTQIAIGQVISQVCPVRQGWTTYTVNPTDSLVRLSVVYGVSIEEMAKASCIGKNAVILPGQIINVPILPTNTPGVNLGLIFPRLYPTNTTGPVQQDEPAQRIIATSVPTSQPTATLAQEPTSTQRLPSPQPSPTNIPPTAAQPTLIAPTQTTETSIPPTETIVPTQTNQRPTPWRRPTRPRRIDPTPTSEPTQLEPTEVSTQLPPTSAPTQQPPPSTDVPTTSPPQPTDESTQSPPPTSEPIQPTDEVTQSPLPTDLATTPAPAGARSIDEGTFLLISEAPPHTSAVSLSSDLDEKESSVRFIGLFAPIFNFHLPGIGVTSRRWENPD